MIDKVVKEFEKIQSSLNKSKKLILADIDKIDEKYRKLAQEEKKNLTESLAILNEQLKYYNNILGGKKIDSEETEQQDEEVEETIQDTIFPDNNEIPEVEDKEETVEENTEEKKGMTVEEVVEKLRDAGMSEVTEDDGAVVFTPSVTDENADPNKWPDYQEKEKKDEPEAVPVIEDVNWGEMPDMPEWK